METLRYVVLVNALLAVVSMAYYVLLRRETFFRTNRLVLWMGIMATLLLPLLELPDWRPQPMRTVMHRTAQVIVPKILPGAGTPKPDITIVSPKQGSDPAFQNQSAAVGWSWPMIFLLVYTGVALILLIRLGVQLISLRRLIRRSVHEPYDDFTLVRNDAVTSPFSFFNWVVLNPDRHASDELEQILRHERVHVRERHSLDMLGAEVICILFWFNPAAYLFRHLLHQTLEFSADQTVLAEGVDARAYQYNLVKVSLSAGQSTVTNHFSKSQLKSRIKMLNQPASSKTTWLKYPVFFIAALTIASAFARPQVIKLSRHLPKPLATGIQSVLETSTPIVAQPLTNPELPTETALIESKISQENKVKPPTRQTTLPIDSIKQQVDEEDVRVSPSRYIFYQGNRMWWIITPLYKPDDFAVLKNQLAKYGASWQLMDVRYNSNHTFINYLNYKLINEGKGSSAAQKVDGGENTPIYASGGFLELIPSAEKYSSSLTYEKIPVTARSIPEGVRRVIVNDEAVAFGLRENQSRKLEKQSQKSDSLKTSIVFAEKLASMTVQVSQMEHMVMEGQRKYGHLGIGFRRFDEEEVKVFFSINGSLLVDKVLNFGRVFINNEPATSEELKKWKIDQLYTVVSILGYDEATEKRSGVTYLLFYVEKNK